MGKKTFIYIFVVVFTLLLLALIEVFLLRPLVDMIGFDYWTHLIVYLILFVFVNPIITKIITDNLKIAKMDKEKTDVIEAELKMCGYFCIITSDKMTAKEALELYKSRDASEKLFKADKSFLGNRSLRVYTGDVLEGKMLIAFVALIIRNRIYTKLKDAEEEMLEKPNYMNVPAAIRELEKIEMIRQADGVYRLDHAVTATQKTILKAFGIDANYIKRKSKEISDWLNPKIHKVKI